MTQVVIESGITTQERTLVGVLGELRYDSDNDSLRIHDFQRAGGHEILARDANDQRYARSGTELSAVAAFGRDDLGFMVRTGAGGYTFRALGVNTGNMTLSGANGTNAAPVFSLATQIETDHAFLGLVAFEQGITAPTFTGDLAGDVLGNVEGNLQGNVTGNVQGNLVGGVDTREAELLVADGSIPISAIIGLGDLLAGLGTVPIGVMMAWSGSIDTIPPGWALCDGDNGTPDMRGRFLIGAGGQYAVGAQVGSASHTHVATAEESGEHVHEITVEETELSVNQIPAHRHLNGVVDNAPDFLFAFGAAPVENLPRGSMEANNQSGPFQGLTSETGAGAGHSHAAESESQGSHTHQLEVAGASNLPPASAYAIIMYVGNQE